jgi:hypothetical protein
METGAGFHQGGQFRYVDGRLQRVVRPKEFSMSLREISVSESDLDRLNPDLVRKLGLLYGAPAATAVSGIALLGFGARALLEAGDYITVSNERPALITITPSGFLLIEACANQIARREGPDWQSGFIERELRGETTEEKVARALSALEERPMFRWMLAFARHTPGPIRHAAGEVVEVVEYGGRRCMEVAGQFADRIRS